MTSASSDWFQAGTCYHAVAPYYQPGPMYQKSKEAFHRAAQMEPQNGAIWTNLGTSEQALGNTDAAFADYQKGARLGNNQGAVRRKSGCGHPSLHDQAQRSNGSTL